MNFFTGCRLYFSSVCESKFDDPTYLSKVIIILTFVDDIPGYESSHVPPQDRICSQLPAIFPLF